MLSTINKYTLYFFTFLVLFSSTIDSQEVDSKKIFKLHVNSNEYGNIYIFDASDDNFILKNTFTGKPLKKTLRKLKFVEDDDIYAIKIFGKNEKYIYSIGIGNPFYANYTHIGFEDREYMGGPVKSANIEITLPLNIEPSFFVISKRDNTNKFNDIQKIELN